MSFVAVDAGFLIALYSQRDQYHRSANEKFVRYFSSRRNRMIVPWPVLYEAVATRLLRHRPAAENFRRDWSTLASTRRLEFLDDSSIRVAALQECLQELKIADGHYRPLSLVDRVIRSLLADRHIRIDIFLTFNPGDFADVCYAHRCELG